MPRYESVYAPTNTKTARKITLNSFISTTKTGGGRGFAVSRKRESYGKNLPFRLIDERRHLEVFRKICVWAMPRYESVYAPTNSKKDRHNCSEFIFRTTKTGGGRGFAVSRRRESLFVCMVQLCFYNIYDIDS